VFGDSEDSQGESEVEKGLDCQVKILDRDMLKF
jgi:hypothetical protein